MDKINYNEEDLADHEGVSAVIKNEKDEILMQEHIKYGFWTIPVGKASAGQGVIEALREEILEECNLIVEKIKEITRKERSYIRNGQKVIVHMHLFEITKYSGIMKNNEPEKHKVQKFIGLEEIKNLPYISDATLLYLESLNVRRKAKLEG